MIARTWEREPPVPPPVIWRNTLERAERLALVALTHPLESLPGQKSWTELPFGTRDAASRNDLPWDPTRKVEIPGAGVFIQGHIDRLDLSGDGSRARVIDYKTGLPKERCLYAFAAKTLLDPNIEIDAALLYPLVTGGDHALFPLQNVDGTLEQLTEAIVLARRNFEAGLALPGIATEEPYNDFAFALRGNARYGYLPRKMALAAEELGNAAKIWEAT